MINLNNWAVTLPTGNTQYPIEFNEFVYERQDSVLLKTPCIGETTPNSNFPRTELREMFNHKRAKWNSEIGKHEFRGIFNVLKLTKKKPEVCVFQIHDGKDDVLQIIVDKAWVKYKFNGARVSLGSSLGERFRIKCKVENGMVSLKYNFNDKILLPLKSNSLYFRTGNYLQSNFEYEQDLNEYSLVEIRDVRVDHVLFQ
jgi:hypothetical protein